jgi:phosphate transport system protein
MSRYEERLEQDLEEIHTQLADVARRVESGLADSIRSVLAGNEELAFNTVLGDEAINTRFRKIDALCHAFIARHLPSAGHLRRISSTQRVNLQLERIGDYTVIISREGLQLKEPPTGPVAVDLEIVANDGRRILHQAIAAFLESNGDAARATQGLASGAQLVMDRIYEQLQSEELEIDIKDRIAYFAIYNMLKRLWDQAKNICEETIFLVSGETKPKRVHSILFVDEDNSCLSQMAQAIATKLYPDDAKFSSAGRTKAAELNPELVSFMDAHGFDLEGASLDALPADPHELADHFVVVSLEGPVRSVCPELPFHTAAFRWDVGPVPRGLSESETTQCYEELHRELASRIRDLVDRVTGQVD